MGLSVLPVQNLAYLQYQFIDAKGNEIDMKEEMEIK
jgi:ribonuclease G